MIVADTCLVAHLFNETELTSIAQQILAKDPEWILPRLWQEEYANVLSRLARREKRTADEVIKHFSYTVEELKHGEIPIDTKTALRYSIDYRISVYDAHFVALAIQNNTLLVTEDLEILKRCPQYSIGMQQFLTLTNA